MPDPLPSVRGSRRDQVLDGLTDLFLTEGFLSFGIGDLAAALKCSRTTVYTVAESKEQIVLAAVRHYFRRAAARIEERVTAEERPRARLGVYLTAVAEELEPASPRFHADLAAYRPAGDIYRDNTQRAARRVQDLVTEGAGDGGWRAVDAAFVGAVVAEVMSAIQSGSLEETTGLDNAAAYRALADLVLNGLRGSATGD
ncbi:MAG: TetR/AcrR family transcriptional regulator [Nocardioides sp.]|uniref:TetR/AcrR family transcriptional regulator n=1 Tax=Nocardioides sp. TaxID=35761 RepID=UPI00238D63B6|nr:TetR/AcrR family transcriptional regulator [Nocardioides sp.]MDE0775845.1 TetR/AcrR family transcriptional regulator [Nocardioides sp.]